MPQRKNAIRLAVTGDEGQLLSSVWRIWLHGDDVYVAVRSLAGSFKTSLHRSGKFRHAFVTDSEAERFRGVGKDRAVHKWSRPAEQIPGGTLLFQIVIPEPGLHLYSAAYKIPAGLVQIDKPPKNHVTYVSTVETDKAVVTTGPVFADQPTRVLASWRTRDDRTIWIVSHAAMLTEDNLRTLDQIRVLLKHRNVTEKVKAPSSYAGEVRGFFLMKSPDGVGRVLDLKI